MHDSLASDGPAPGPGRSAVRGRPGLTALVAALIGAGLLAGLSSSVLAPSPEPVAALDEAGPAEVASAELPPAQETPVAEAPASGTDTGALPFPAPAALRSALNQPAPSEVADPAPATPFAQQDPLPETSAPTAEAAPQIIPLPMPRPTEFRTPDARAATRRAERAARRARVVTAAPVQPEDDRNFFEKFFGIERKAAPALAYAALETNGAIEALPRRPLTPVPPPAAAPRPAPSADGGVAVYDISARTVTLPSGEKLEAHSGLGAYMDDPRYVHEKMRGPTPPGTYDLTEREALFHNVRAIRLTPVGGSEAVHNRVGLLAHTFMLGPQGASNGCVSFRDYNRFLQAYLAGQVQRLVVVAGARGQDSILSVFASR